MKRKISPAIVSVLLIASLCSCQKSAQYKAAKPVVSNAREAASLGLKTFPAMINEKNFSAMGFRSVSEVRQARLGEPMKVFTVRLDKLMKYQDGIKADTLLEKANSQVMYPLTVNSEARCSITVALRKEQWVVTQFGSSSLTQLVSSARRASVEKTRLPLSAYMIIQVNALNMVFVGHQDRETNELMLTPVEDYPNLELRMGSSQPATEVFQKLVPLAQGHNGLPT
jgi:hypothetical protein